MIHPSKIIKELGIAPLKKLGQNFQVDVHAVENVAAFIDPAARVLEIGPGLGAWTEVFLQRGHEMVLVEKDRTLARRLREVYATNTKVQVIEGDFLEQQIDAEPFAACNAAIGNLPFYVTADLLLKIICDAQQIHQALFGIQYEVAERLAARGGSSLAIALACQGEISIAGKIGRNSFFPVPNVDAAIIRFERRANIARPHLRTLLKAAFWGKRKPLRSALAKNPFFAEDAAATGWPARLAAIPERLQPLMAQRADDLTAAEFCELYDFLNAGK
ncbi:ribosomal RNA small subunit methyltransferase A [Turneriella parva]|uniref:Ribosomal RNA adenine methylase transferase n=1 Tax=Turneriella parva (strain ATCC BAA-1111 / DSM 21527 / NCTC 11395 / H) TaxID=869212 RepID=I4B7H1_TURPD|nr:rRNA adenine dimethyltransferase family protein [Turneriella parva]AFM13228.1 ribosomal RNA adenine methylase transferase [Turneriella parva DSM 21527]